MAFVIKAEIDNADFRQIAFSRQKTMYGGKRIAHGDRTFLFASETQGGKGLIARGLVACAKPMAPEPGVDRQTPRVSVTIEHIARAKRTLGRSELRRHTDWGDGRPMTELNFKLYRQATNKIVGISDETAAFLDTFF
jgi:hypothetical protein